MRVSTAQQDLVIAAMREGLVFLDAEGRVMAMNPAAETMLGLDLATSLNHRFQDLTAGALDAAGVAVTAANHPVFAPKRAGQRAHETVLGLIRPKTGQTRWLAIRALYHPQADDSAPPPACLLLEDVTAEREAAARHEPSQQENATREALERSMAELAEAQRIAGVGSWSVDAATGEGRWSDEMFRIMGHDPALGTPNLADAYRFSTPEEVARGVADVQRVMEHGDAIATEIELKLQGGIHRRVIMRAEPARDASGRIVGARGTYQDVTEQRKLEERLSRSQRLDAIGALAGGVAHDFNNLLTVIIGYTRAVAAELDPQSPLRADLSEVIGAGQRAAALTRQLLAFGRRQVLQPFVLPPNDVIRDLAKMLRRLISENIDLQLHLAEDAGSIYADPGQVEQIVMNLVVNARDAMADSGVLKVETTNADVTAHGALQGVKPGRYVVISVVDTGCGMDEATLARMYEPFYTTKPAGRGTGLGLSTVYGIVQQCGGFIDVESGVGSGTRFAVYLPQVEPDGDKRRPSSSYNVRPIVGDGTVLLVEDDGALRTFAARALTAAGYTVLAASGGEEALRIARATLKLDALVCDMVMPGMGGAEVAEAVREAHPGVDVLFVSGYIDEEWGRNAVVARGQHFLAKPFTADEFVRKVWKMRHPSRPNAARP